MIFRKIDKMIAREILSYTFTILPILTTVALVNKFQIIFDFLISSDNLLLAFIMFLIYYIPYVLKYTLPISLLFSSTIASMNLIENREWDVVRVSGDSLLSALRAPIVISVCCTALVFSSIISIEPYSNRQWANYNFFKAQELVASAFRHNLKPNSFFEDQTMISRHTAAFYVENQKSNEVYLNSKFFLNDRNNQNQITKALSSQKFYIDKEEFSPLFISGTLYDFNEDSSSLASMTQFQKLSIHFDEILSFYKSQPGEAKLSGRNKFYLSNYIKAFRERHQDPKYFLDAFTYFSSQLATVVLSSIFTIFGFIFGIYDVRRKQFFVYFYNVFLIVFIYTVMNLLKIIFLEKKFLPIPFIVLLTFISYSLLFVFYRWREYHPITKSFTKFLTRNQLVRKFIKSKNPSH